jgi:hypothetical protein
MWAVWRGGADAAPSLLKVSDDSAPDTGDDSDGDYGETRSPGDAHTGELLGFEYSTSYVTRPDGVTLYLTARKKEEGDPEQMEEKMQDTEQEAAKDEKELHENLKKLSDAGYPVTSITLTNSGARRK